MKLISRQEARKLALRYYCTGKPCKHGHLASRYVSTKACVECMPRYRKINPNRNKQSCSNYYKKNKIKWNSYVAARNAQKKQALTSYTSASSIRVFYENCPPGYEVDHMIPLTNPHVCGLHVRANLQYLSAYENRSKGNKLLEEYATLPTIKRDN